ncbi:MAG: hypothetical protein NTX03_09505 [Bacteroidetes bacterium]|nr:hypothetical protein [Bacteroidota bacterium]
MDPSFTKVVSFYNPYSPANNWALKSTSPAHNTGTDGTDMGPWGGSLPFVTIGGEPSLPLITDFRINNPAVPLNGKLNITVKVKKVK